MKSLKHLTCRIDVGSLELISQLTELRKLLVALEGVVDNIIIIQLYKIIQANPQLECMMIKRIIFLDVSFILEVTKILHSVRDLSVQKPLKLLIAFKLKPAELQQIDSKYIELNQTNGVLLY
ncbi:uncharacterized protein LOC115629628 [Scaptodrosophila lebanonensis]|uniref:Uncharacterized protein LOC115629628 n=1 Tax=Drosophila lebanonensis TaxID=7225 RepID=A0A6J2U0V4_DROLE|nr:uncharacterized protein LOC115629628 [Scaptodrosophila lebanonensis]